MSSWGAKQEQEAKSLITAVGRQHWWPAQCLIGNSKLPASMSHDMQGESPGSNDETRNFIIAVAKWVLFKISFVVFLWECICCSTIIRTICLTRNRARIFFFFFKKRGDYELGCVTCSELGFLCAVGRIRCFLRCRDLNHPFLPCRETPKQIKPQGRAGDRFLSSFLDSVTDLLPAVSLPLLLTYKILHLIETCHRKVLYINGTHRVKTHISKVQRNTKHFSKDWILNKILLIK